VADSFTIHDLPRDERPGEELQRYCAEALSAAEILALIMGRGISGESVMVTAQRLLSQFGDLEGISGASVEDVSKVSGIGLAKAAQIKAAFELANRLEGHQGGSQQPLVVSPKDVAAAVSRRFRGKKKELFLALFLDSRSRLIKNSEISVGSLDTSIVHPREVFKEALAASAASVIFAHNHPSGDTTPSEEDVSLSKRLVEAGQIMGVDVLDHIIFAGRDYLSLKRRGQF
jgi:DNA repair protein RadC